MASKNSVTLRLGSEGAEQVTAKLREIGETAHREFSRATKEVDAATRSFGALERRLDPLAKANHDLATAQAVATRAVAAGATSHADAGRIIDLATERHRRLTQGLGDNAKAAGLAKHEWVNLGRQLTDVGTSLAGGASPFMVLTQQGGQIADVFGSSKGGAAAAFKDFGGAVLRVALHPATLLATAAAGTSLAMLRWKEQTDALTVSLNGLGRQSGLTLSQLNALAERSAVSGGMSQAQARGLAGQFLSAGVPRSTLGGGVAATQDFSRRLGLPLEKAGEIISQALADPAKGAEELSKRFGLVTFAQREHIKQLAAVGDRSTASAKLLEILGQRLAAMEDPTWRVTRLLDRVTNSISDSVDAWAKLVEQGPVAFFTGSADRAKETADRARADQQEKEANESRAAERADELRRLREDSDLAVRAIQARTFEEKAAVEMERARTAAMRETTDAVKAGIAAESKRAELLAEAAQKADDTLRSARDQNELSRLSPYDRSMREIDFKYRDLRAELVPNAATPMAAAFETAATAARSVAAAFTDLVSTVGGKRVINVTRAGGAHAPYADIIAAEGTGRYGDPYNTSLGYMRSPKPLTKMTMAESLDWGQHVRRAQGVNSSAKGAFQIVNSTQRAAMSSLGFSGSDMFDEEHQRALADWVFKTQGLGAWEGFKRRGVRATPGVNDNGRSIAGTLRGAEEQERDARRFELIQRPLEDANREIERQRVALSAQSAAMGKSAEETTRAAKAQELLSDFQARGVPLTDALRASIAATADNAGRLAAEQEAYTQSQERVKAGLDLLRESSRDLASGLVSAFRQGKDAGQELLAVLERIADKILNSALDSGISALLGRSGEVGGGVFGGLLSGLFKFESGGVMSSGGAVPLRRYATGGVANSPQLALFGEGRQPEAFVPLPDGRAIPVALQMKNNASSGARGGMPKMTFIDQSTGVTVTPRMSDGEILMLIESRVSASEKRAPGAFAAAQARAF